MEGEVAVGTWNPSYIRLTGVVDWDKKLEAMIDSATARRMLNEIFDVLPTYRKALIDEEATLSHLSERVRHMKIMIRFRLGRAQSDVWSL